jgi:hypothetical protein
MERKGLFLVLLQIDIIVLNCFGRVENLLPNFRKHLHGVEVFPKAKE